MNKLFEAMKADVAFSKALECYQAQGQNVVYGLTGTQKSAVIAAAYQQNPRATVIVTGNNEGLEQLHTDLGTLLPDAVIADLPALDIVTFSAAAKSVELAARRMDVLGRLVRQEKIIVLATIEAAMQKGLSRQEFENNRLNIAVGIEITREQVLENLVRFGYERVDQVGSIGQFSARGGIVDVFPVNVTAPLRIEFFGDEIDSLRQFDIVTQRSSHNVTQADILPLTEPEHSAKPAVFLSYLPQPATIIFDEPTRIREQLGKLIKENPELKRRSFTWADITSAAKNYNIIYLSLMLQKIPYTEPTEIISVAAKGIAPFHRQMDMVISELNNLLERNFTPIIFLSNEDKAVAFQQSLSEQGVSASYASKIKQLAASTVLVTVGVLSGGFELPQARLAVIVEKDIFGRQKKRPRPRAAKGQQITYFRDINLGDYVVHANHGIGKYVGVETLSVGGVNKDYLHIRYAGEDKLYVPTDQVHLLQKYIGSEGEAPRLHKMGGVEWLKAKSKAKAAVADMAKELLALYAERQVGAGYAFEPDTPWQKEFEDTFPFEETPDQLAAIAEIKADMEKPRPMDRLLCGDVGFGKTEVAIRAAFKAVMSGKQVAVLVPTTVLAQQHFQTFLSRFAGFGPVVDVVSRFRSAKEQKATLAKVASGQVDVLIGTHRMLNADVVFKDLGLLIVDEEQRFGVAQKEKLKKWRCNIDVLTLSATPIPRTLHMSLVNARDMSIIETPPEDRFPVQTYVVEYNEQIIRDAIKRELKRGGQVYFVYNRVETIDKVQRQLSEMLPDAKIQSAHGQMPEELLEQVMLDFYEGHDEVLVCTSIIENGLDVSNANTIVIYDADHFGLSQLYQMRGRVGRSHRMAFAYFTYRADKVLTEVAEKRLQAIKEFAELGAGFKIAMRDLEIRGAGNLLGAQQHGHIASVGFEMYCRLLEEAVQELRTGRRVELPVEPVLELNVEAYLSGDYIGDAMHKIEIYQRIAAIRNEEHVSQLLDELIDRFGDPPKPVLNLLTVARIKNIARQLGVKSIIQQLRGLEIIFGDQPNVNITGILELKAQFGSNVTMLPGPPEIIKLRLTKLAENNLLDVLHKLLKVLIK
ncbi:transcription-repair coupling factor|uniref:Transcription-repair-coupling factor n=1 Tax=Dendrosporobacter quercicolus TaxID=146817 RepID=A0A1G9UW81_9FIRM|nr:transcription-repair coupling factor [Dendrosporobacter quercicolus]NSL48005.1 transcription-repair coupling factor [Dendrosporobacter quercicolus DSM 1736]SDM64198.1 transcription-repair coupling factor (superfamily II helicase) [Dendrosporobacter quercicolus]